MKTEELVRHAAPKMLAALKLVSQNGDMRAQARFCVVCAQAMKKVDEAIAEAEGRS